MLLLLAQTLAVMAPSQGEPSIVDRLPVPLPVLVIGVVVILSAVGRLVASRRRAAVADAHEQAAQEHGLTTTDRPLGVADDDWGRFALLPRGPGERSAVHGLEGPVTTRLGEHRVELLCASFEWWWEGDHVSDNTTRRHRLGAVVAAIRLPAGCQMPHVRVAVGDWFSRRGFDDDDRVGSEEFDRRFRVAVEDEAAVEELFTAEFQQAMLDRFVDVGFELWGDLAVVVTDSDQSSGTVGTDRVSWAELDEIARRSAERDQAGLGDAPPDARRSPTWPTETTQDRIGTRTDVVDALLDARETAVALLGATPAGWWRRVGAIDG